MAPVFHTDDNAPGFIMSSVQSPCLLFCPAHSPPLLHTPWLLSFVSLSVTALPVHCENEKQSKPYPPARHAGKCSLGTVGSPLCPLFLSLSFCCCCGSCCCCCWTLLIRTQAIGGLIHFENLGEKLKHISAFWYREYFMNI